MNKKLNLLLAVLLSTTSIASANIAIGTTSGNSFTFNGATTNTNDQGSVAIGYGTTSNNTGTIAIGNGGSTGTTASGLYAIAMGIQTQATGYGSIAEGALATASASHSTAIGMQAQAIGQGSTAYGQLTTASGLFSTAIGSGGTYATADYSTALGSNARTSVFGGVALGGSARADREGIANATTSSSSSAASGTIYSSDLATSADNDAIKATVYGAMGRQTGMLGAVAIGGPDGTRQITYVAAGSDDSDAVNVAQLKAVANTVKYSAVEAGNGTTVTSTQSGATTTYTVSVDDKVLDQINTNTSDISSLNTTVQTNDNRITQLESSTNSLSNGLNRLDKKVDNVAAGSAALAGLHPLDFDPDNKFSVAVAGGFYQSEQALALGAFYRPNEDTMFNVASTLGEGDNMVTIGASFKVGERSGDNKLREQYKTAPISTVYVLAQEVEQLKVQHQEDQERLARLESIIANLQQNAVK